jgi:hypothetical protein
VSRLQALHGVFVGSHAVAEGLVTKRQLQSGLYRRLLRNVYADPSLAADHQLFARGAALPMPPGAALAGRSAATWFGAPFASVIDPVLVVVPPDSTWRGPRGIRLHRTALRPDEATSIEDVPCTTPLWTAWDIAALEPVANAVGMLDGMVRAGHLDLAAFVRVAEAGRGRWGSARVAEVVPLIDGRSESPPESWVRVACARAGLPAPLP